MNSVKWFYPIMGMVFWLSLSGCGREKKMSYFDVPTDVGGLALVESEELSFRVDTLLTDLEEPYKMTFLPNGDVLITLRDSGLVIVRDGKPLDQPVQNEWTEGLRDIVLHPNHEENGWIYLTRYVDPEEGVGSYTMLMRAKLRNDELVEEEVLYKAGPFRENGVWYGSTLVFDADGYLLVTIGQRTIDDKHRMIAAQDLTKTTGKIMRFNDDGSVPADNPFVDSVGVLPEIYTYGHRQPQGIILNPIDHEIWCAEHGEMGGDELNVIFAGRNYGWPEVTHSVNYDGTRISEDSVRVGIEAPTHHWTPAISPLSLTVVTGDRYPGWEGNFLVGSGVQRMLNRTILEDGGTAKDEVLLKDIGRVRDVKQAPDGYVYLLTEDTGFLVRLLPVN